MSGRAVGHRIGVEAVERQPRERRLEAEQRPLHVPRHTGARHLARQRPRVRKEYVAARRVLSAQRGAVRLAEMRGVDERGEHLPHRPGARVALLLGRILAVAQRLAQALAALPAPHALEPAQLRTFGLRAVPEPLPVEGRTRGPLERPPAIARSSI